MPKPNYLAGKYMSTECELRTPALPVHAARRDRRGRTSGFGPASGDDARWSPASRRTLPDAGRIDVHMLRRPRRSPPCKCVRDPGGRASKPLRSRARPAAGVNRRAPDRTEDGPSDRVRGAAFRAVGVEAYHRPRQGRGSRIGYEREEPAHPVGTTARGAPRALRGTAPSSR